MAITAWFAKLCDQLDLLLAEWMHFLTVDADHTDQPVLLEHRHRDDGPISPKLSPGDHKWIAPLIGFPLRTIDDVRDLFCPGGAAETTIGGGRSGARWRSAMNAGGALWNAVAWKASPSYK